MKTDVKWVGEMKATQLARLLAAVMLADENEGEHEPHDATTENTARILVDQAETNDAAEPHSSHE